MQGNTGHRLPFLAAAALCILGLVCLMVAMAAPDAADASRSGHGKAKAGKSKGAKQRHAKSRRAQRQRAMHRRARRANRKAAVAPQRAVGTKKAVAPAPAGDVLDAGFEAGLLNWNTAGVGETLPTVVTDEVRSGAAAGRVVLSGSQHRSELILGGNGGGSTSGMIEFDEGDEYWYAFSFNIDSMVYGEPGAHNLIMQFKGDDGGSPAFGLQLWDYEGDDGEYEGNSKGLWSHGPAMDGDRFLAPVSEQAWHDVVIHFRASANGSGFYELYLDGALIDSRQGVSMIAGGADYAYIKNGLYRNGDEIPGTSELHLDAARLATSASAIAAG